MGQQAVERALGKLVTDGASRKRFFANPETASREAGLQLSAMEQPGLERKTAGSNGHAGAGQATPPRPARSSRPSTTSRSGPASSRPRPRCARLKRGWSSRGARSPRARGAASPERDRRGPGARRRRRARERGGGEAGGGGSSAESDSPRLFSPSREARCVGGRLSPGV